MENVEGNNALQQAAQESLPNINLQQGAKIQQNSMLLMVTFQAPGMRRSVGKGYIADKKDDNAEDFAISIDSDINMVTVSKSIIDSPEYRDIMSHRNGIKRGLGRVGVKGVFRPGCYLIPTEGEVLDAVDTFVEERIEEDKVLVKKFIKAYPARKKEAKRLRALLNEDDYPTVGQLESAFSITKRYFTFETPNSLKKLNKEKYDREKERTIAFWADTAKKVETALIESFLGFINDAVERLTGGPKAKTFTDAAMKKLDDFFDMFDNRNMTKNPDLTNIVAKARKVTKGLDATAIRDEGQVRKSVKEGFEKIRIELNNMIVDKPSRKIRL